MVFDIQQFAHGRWTVVAVVGDVDLAGAPAFRAAIATGARTAFEQGGGLAVDLRAVDFLDSIGIGVVVGGLRRQLDRHLPFAVVVDGSVRVLFERLRLHEIITLCSDRDQLGDRTS